jgi:hemoglobin-like flavoprotein
MNASAAATVRASFAALAPKLPLLVERFYATLFSAHPELRVMFPQDMARQRDHLAAAFAVLVRNVDSLQAMEESLMGLGARHVAFGTLPEHYPMVRDALLESIAAAAQPAWTPQMEEAWRAALNAVCAVMLRGAAMAAIAVAQKMSPEHTVPASTKSGFHSGVRRIG